MNAKERFYLYGGLILILLTCIGILYVTYTYAEELSNNPLIYGLKKYGLSSCYCLAENGDSLSFNDTTIKLDKTVSTFTGGGFSIE